MEVSKLSNTTERSVIGQLRIYISEIGKECDDAKAEIAELKKENEQQKIEMLSLHSHSKCPCKNELIIIRNIMRSMYRYPSCWHSGRGPKVVQVLDICDRLIHIQNNTVKPKETGEEFLRRAESYSIGGQLKPF
jgi:hypothetical protein